MRLFGTKIGIDDEFLQGKTQIPDFRQIESSPGGKSRQDSLSIGIGGLNLRIYTARPMRLRVDLRGNGTLSNAMFTHDQHRAVALGDAGNRTLNLRLDRGKRFRLPFYALDGCNGCHKGS